MRRWAMLFLSLVVGAPGPAVAQVFGTGVMPVVEVGANVFHNAITAGESVMQTANMILELTPLDEIILGGQLMEDLGQLGDVLSSAELVWYDLKSLEGQISSLFGVDNAPDTRAGLDERLYHIQQLSFAVLSYAMRTQTLVVTMFRTVEHINQLVTKIGALLGNMQSNQTIIQMQMSMSKTLAVMEVQQAAWQRADTIDRLSDQLIRESLRKIALKRLEDHPRY